MSLKYTLKEYQQNKKGILATNFYNLETLQGVLLAASVCNVPLMLQLTKSSIDYMGIKEAVLLARQSMETYGVKGWLHLDHGGSIDLIKRCLDEGFDSVMIDASHLSLNENISVTREVVELAKSYNVNVEAELGYIAKLGQESTYELTSVSDATEFVEETGVDSLAIAIGSAHGFYKSEPKLNIERLSEIHKALRNTILVLHGSSGIPDGMLQEAIVNGITKINLATEIKDTFMSSLKNVLKNTDEIDLRVVFPQATKAVSNLLVKKFNTVSFR